MNDFLKTDIYELKKIYCNMVDEESKTLFIRRLVYNVTGKLPSGQIAVDLGEGAKEDPEAVVTLVLNGVDITCEIAPAVIFYSVYAVKKDFSEDLYQSELRTCNPYNTSAFSSCPVVGLPIGPICNAGLSSISASVNPIENEYYYFVADKEKNTYFNVTYEEHAATVTRLKEEGKWYEY